VLKGKRNGPRDLLLRTQKDPKAKLTIQKHALAKKILFDGNRAVGVEYYDGPHVYRADPAARKKSDRTAGVPVRQIRAAKEVIVSAGAFNSPQLLKLSGVGPRDELTKWGIDVVAELPGVGENLQDRYEVGVISRFKNDFKILGGGATFALPQPGVPDPAFEEWKKGEGLYTSNGSIIGIIKRSKPSLKYPDLYIFGLPGFFKGYMPGYSKETERHHNLFTWAVLKAHTNNTRGRVTLRSADATDWPKIEFKYFGEGSDGGAEDLDGVVDGVEFARAMNKRLGDMIETEVAPGPDKTGARLREFIENEAWGHHASCTNKMGVDADPMAVLDSRFRVRKTKALRVVDASVFPRIPGYFIVTPIYMISEKASDVIREDA
jgi:choline dehydrogenase